MKNSIVLIFCFFGFALFSQTSADSVAIKNKLLIEQLRNRIAVIEDPNKIINELKSKEKLQQDSIEKLNALLKQLSEKQLTEKYNTNKQVDIQELNKDLKNNSFVLSELGDCGCTRIYYNSNQTEVDYSVFNELDSLALICIKDSNKKLKLIGHADKTGSEAHNVYLSKARVTNLKNYLVNNKKVAAKNIIIEWHGSAIPFKDASEPEKQFLNRRAEIFLE